MTFELIINIGLLLFFIYTFFYVGATMPPSPNTEIGPEQWPQALAVLLAIGLIVNIIGIIRENKKLEKPKGFSDVIADTKAFFKSKLLIGMIIVAGMAFIMEPLGFLVTCTLFIVAYGLLLGNRKYIQLIVVSILITTFLYVLFSAILGIMLPRGRVPFLRDIALGIESLIYAIKKGVGL